MPSAISVDSSSSSGNGLSMEDHGALQLLSQDMVLPITIPMMDLFEKIMEVLGVETRTVITEEECGNAGVRFTIKMDVSDLPSITGQRLLFAYVEGEPKLNRQDAEASAVQKILDLLESNHNIRIIDFSSRVAPIGECRKNVEILSEAIEALDKVLGKWDEAFQHCEKLVGELERKQDNDSMYAPRSTRARVFGFLSEYLNDQLNNFNQRTQESKAGVDDARTQLANLAITTGGEFNNNTSQFFHDVVLPPTYILNCVMSFFGLAMPYYVSTMCGNGLVKSTVLINFPRLEDFRVSGNIELEGQSNTSHEADEEAAHVALLFIEENFNTKVVDYNYRYRAKHLEEQMNVSGTLSNVLDIADQVKMMFGELINAVEGQRLQFSVEPRQFFSGPMSSGQIEAFNFCYIGTVRLGEDLSKCYSECSDCFGVLNKITWNNFISGGNVYV